VLFKCATGGGPLVLESPLAPGYLYFCRRLTKDAIYSWATADGRRRRLLFWKRALRTTFTPGTERCACVVCVRESVCVCSCVRLCTINTHTHAHTHTHTHTHTHAHTHTHTNTHTDVCIDRARGGAASRLDDHSGLQVCSLRCLASAREYRRC
jgi:hypothetical protein